MTKTMIKKSLRAYISRRQLEFVVLPDGKVVRVFLFQRVKQQVHGIFEVSSSSRASLALIMSSSVEKFFSSSGASYQM